MSDTNNKKIINPIEKPLEKKAEVFKTPLKPRASLRRE